MDSTLTPQSKLDDIKTYLVPHEQVVRDDEVMQFVLDTSISHSIQQVTYDGVMLTDDQYLARAEIFKSFLNQESKIRNFVKSQIVKQIDEKCHIYNKVGMRCGCEWFHYVSTLDKLNREKNNSFLSCLKDFLSEITMKVLTKLFYVAEQNGIISSHSDIEKEKFLDHQSQIEEVWIHLYALAKDVSLTCDQKFESNFPFTKVISQSVERYRQIFMERVENDYQLEQRINERADE